MEQIQSRIQELEDEIPDWERWFEDTREKLQAQIDELDDERAYYRSKLRELEHDSDLLH